MTRKFLLLFLLTALYTNAQYIASTPWMKKLNSKKLNQLSKNRDGANQNDNQHSIYEIRKAFDDYWESSGKDPNVKGSGFKQFKRWENYWKHLVDSKGMLPSSKSLWDSDIIKEQNLGKTNTTSSWTPIGPNRPGTLAGTLPGTGRINTAFVDPNDPNIWYAGAPAGGIWKSEDAGDNWLNLFDNFLQIGVSGIAIHSSDSNTIYIATGDDDAGDSFSAGVFKSTDGGITWNETGLNPTNTNVGLLMNEIFINPDNQEIIFVGSNQGLFRSQDGGDNFEIILEGNINDFRLKPNDPSTVYAVTESEFFKSVNGGDTFSRIEDILPGTAGRSVMEVTEANPDAVYILMAESFPAGGGFLGLFTSVDNGETFTASPNTVNIFEANQTFFNLALEVSPTDENLLFTGALNIWSSANGGESFLQTNQWFINNESYTHADIHFIRYFGDTLFVGSDGGLYTSTDNGATFTDKTGNMQVTQFYRIDIVDDNTNRIAGGTQDNSGFILNGGQWNVFTQGDGMDYEISPNNPDLVYGFVQFGGALFVSGTAGQSSFIVGPPTDNTGQEIEGNWITPLTIGSDNNVYAGYDRVYRLEPTGWVRISNDFASSNIEDLEVAPSEPSILYASDENRLFRSSNSGITFEEIAELPTEISSIAVNTSNPNVTYVATSRRVGIPEVAQPLQKGIYEITYDALTETTLVENRTSNLPSELSFFSIVHQDRNSNNPIFIGTHLGVYRTDDTLDEWEVYDTGLPSVAVGDLEIDATNGLIVASTYGRGAWISPIPVQVPDNDIALTALTPMDNTFICGEVIPQISVTNNGLETITTVNISTSVNGNGPLSFEWSGTIESGGTENISLPRLPNLPPNTAVALEVRVNINGDAFKDNNILTNNFFFSDTGQGGFRDDFETLPSILSPFNVNFSGDILFDEDKLWEQGIPEGQTLDTAPSGNQVFATNLDRNYTDLTTAVLISPCYELSSIADPVLRFDMAYDIELNFDLIYVQYSLDSGMAWQTLGSINSQPNWYNSDRSPKDTINLPSSEQDCQNCIGAQWTGTNSSVEEYAYDFTQNAAMGETDLTNEDNVIFRIVFQSDASVTAEGAIIDNFGVDGAQLDDDDDDNDGVLDVNDNCPMNANANQIDTDSDGIGDICDDDDDNDGILDIDDNCPLTPNFQQEDDDNDGIGNVCDEDLDNDGVPNNIDQCPGTGLDEIVGLDGCPIFNLSPDNFQILTTGESCSNNNNGSITVTTAENLDYLAVLTNSSGLEFSQSFTVETTFENLSAGAYELCISVTNDIDFQRCFSLSITQPEPLVVVSSINNLESQITLALNGGTNYTVNVNGETYSTTETEITVPLRKIKNEIFVRTDKDCQGFFSQTILLNEKVIIYPNPIGDEYLHLILPSDNTTEEVYVSLFSPNGTLLYTKKTDVSSNEVSFNFAGFPSGLYVLNISDETSLTNYKILKR